MELEVGLQEGRRGGRVDVQKNLFGEESAELLFRTTFADQRGKGRGEARLVRTEFPRLDQFLLEKVRIENHRGKVKLRDDRQDRSEQEGELVHQSAVRR